MLTHAWGPENVLLLALHPAFLKVVTVPPLQLAVGVPQEHGEHPRSSTLLP
jgi:hypothetical protein